MHSHLAEKSCLCVVCIPIRGFAMPDNGLTYGPVLRGGGKGEVIAATIGKFTRGGGQRISDQGKLEI